MSHVEVAALESEPLRVVATTDLESGQTRTLETFGRVEPALPSALAWIALDSRQDPRSYLDDAIAPHGGE
jgi:hypothetical protein